MKINIVYVAIPVCPIIGRNQDINGSVVQTIQKGNIFSSGAIVFLGELNSISFYIASVSYSFI